MRYPPLEWFVGAVLLITSSAQQRAAAALQQPHPGSVIVVTDDNFDALTASTLPWIIVFGAPWCPHCKELAPVIETLAKQLSGKINVGKVDGTVERVLLKRFNVEAFPTIYHLTGSECREFVEPRTLNKLLHFAEGGWQGVAGRASYRSPTSSLGRFYGTLRMQPRKFQLLYIHLHSSWGLSNLTLLALMLLLPIAMGIALICALDHASTRPSVQRTRAALNHPHIE